MRAVRTPGTLSRDRLPRGGTAIELLRRIGLGLLVAVVTGIGAAFGFAIVLAIVDLYLAGHGRPTLARPWIERPAWGVHLSRADVIMLAGSTVLALGAGVAAAVAWKPARGRQAIDQ